ncbi:hypothetical protein [Flavobacterium sp.]|uniref:hypothetical protein n=1 Tax=Flavobacterium sp. TaxID=239 RepID=UPI0012204AB7|nr:hypothetical protein [Flavobacterium sp.]RZJ69224.1 MAG: hypothetical protein EOO49_18170 [Flavobacterium sp.]
MEKNQSVRSLFGLTHAEMAMLLGVGISHYSMFESGQRDIPLAARQILNELLAHRQASQAKAEAKQKGTAKPDESQQKHLKRLLLENEYQSAKLEREIAAVVRKKEKSIGILQLQDFFASLDKNEVAAVALARVPLAGKTAKATNTDCDSVLMKLRIRQELLGVEKNYLISKLKSK